MDAAQLQRDRPSHPLRYHFRQFMSNVPFNMKLYSTGGARSQYRIRRQQHCARSGAHEGVQESEGPLITTFQDSNGMESPGGRWSIPQTRVEREAGWSAPEIGRQVQF